MIKNIFVTIFLLSIGSRCFSQTALPAAPGSPHPVTPPVAEKTVPKPAEPKANVAEKPARADTVSVADEKGGHIKIPVLTFRQQAIEKTKQFEDYIRAISNSGTSSDEVDKNIDLAVQLFTNEDATVQVSNNLTNLSHKYKIRTYLNKLSQSFGHYQQVKVEYTNVAYVPKFRKGADGNYYSVVTFIQKFEGFIEGKMVYSDFTKKDVTVVLKKYVKEVNGESVSKFDLFLSDIGIKATMKEPAKAN